MACAVQLEDGCETSHFAAIVTRSPGTLDLHLFHFWLCCAMCAGPGWDRPWVKKSTESVKRSAGALVVDDLGSSAQARSRFTGNNAETCHGSTCCGRNLGIGSMHLAGMRRKQLGLSLGCVVQYVWHGRLTFSKRQEIPYQQQGPSLSGCQ